MAAIEVPARDEIINALRLELATALQDVKATVNLDSVTADTPLLSLPLDSLALMALMTQVEDRYRVFIPEEKMFGFKTVGEVADYVRTAVEAKAAKAAKAANASAGGTP